MRGIARWGLAAALAGSFILAACEPLPQPARIELGPDETLRISRDVWVKYLEYLEKLWADSGAFVVGENGLGAGYVGCAMFSRCLQNKHYARRAINLCEKEAVKCIVFAEGATILVDYEIVD